MTTDLAHSTTSDKPTICYVSLMNEAETTQIATQLAQNLRSGLVYLVGGLGAGKTTFTRAWLQAKGYVGAVKSPTYTLVEPYQISGQSVFHFDLYRLNDPFELELMGIRDYFVDREALSLIEWPQKGQPVISDPDLQLTFEFGADDVTRHLTIEAFSPAGIGAIAQLDIPLSTSLDRAWVRHHE
jgi:tRNA threonylcarbamoyladenosine biosynthesis protein TsaE